ncbi:hypothetical protein [Paenibacillus sp. NRS-1760]|uniref:hypothetical protein n=1 Tax=Paenibacillus sp. NRS-1760 TaxID=3233902 RepID=UPI003D26AC26
MTGSFSHAGMIATAMMPERYPQRFCFAVHGHQHPAISTEWVTVYEAYAGELGAGYYLLSQSPPSLPT